MEEGTHSKGWETAEAQQHTGDRKSIPGDSGHETRVAGLAPALLPLLVWMPLPASYLVGRC